MEIKDILGFAIERASALNGLWNIYIAVATGVLGVMASGKAFTTSKILKVFLSLVFVVFAYSNLDAILRLGDLRNSLLQMLPTGMDALKLNLKPAEPLHYKVFHLVLDAIVVAAIWFVPWPRKEDGSHSS